MFVPHFSSSMSATVYLYVKGKVQNVMFRQTIMRGSIKRQIIAGATNHKEDRNRVDVTLQGDQKKIDEIITKLRSGEEINSWHARCDEVIMQENGKAPLEHEVNTSNVDSIKWAGGVKFYL